MKQGGVFSELLNSFERIASHCVSLSGIVRRRYQDHPDYHVHSAKAQELTPEEYQSIYDDFLLKYDVLSDAQRPISLEDESVK